MEIHSPLLEEHYYGTVQLNHYNLSVITASRMYNGLAPSSIPQGSGFRYRAGYHNVVD